MKPYKTQETENVKVPPSMSQHHQQLRKEILSKSAYLHDDIKQLNEKGYLIIHNIIPSKELKLVINESQQLLSNTDFTINNYFGGRLTKRVDGLLGKTRIFDNILLNQRLNDIFSYYLLPNYLLSAYQLIEIFPGQKQQALHTDTGSYCYASERPRKHPLRLSVMFALSDFTNNNGATVIYPKSHLWQQGRIPDTKKDISIKAVMPKGSCIIYLGTIFHAGGANNSKKPRLGLTLQCTQPWIRPQENFSVSTPLDIIPKLNKKIQSMIGFSIHPPSYGNVDGKHPLRMIPKLLDRYSKL